MTRFIIILAALLSLAVPAARAADSAETTGVEVVTDGFSVVHNATYKAPTPPKPARSWKVPADTSLRAVLEGWARTEGWSLYWPRVDQNAEWVTVVDVTFAAADFEEAVTRFMDGLPPELGLAATFNRANSPRLLYVNEATRKQEIR